MNIITRIKRLFRRDYSNAPSGLALPTQCNRSTKVYADDGLMYTCEGRGWVAQRALTPGECDIRDECLPKAVRGVRIDPMRIHLDPHLTHSGRRALAESIKALLPNESCLFDLARFDYWCVACSTDVQRNDEALLDVSELKGVRHVLTASQRAL